MEGPQKKFRIGVVSATINSNAQSFVTYKNFVRSMKKACRQARKRSDIIFALTHLSIDEDEKAMRKLKHIRLIMGGHEHQHNYVQIKKGAIAKADANAKTMYRHLVFTNEKGKIQIRSQLLNVDSTVAFDSSVAAAVKEWEDKSYTAFRKAGLDPDGVVYHTNEPLDGREESVRYEQTNLGQLIAQAIWATSPPMDAALFNSGSIRIDDEINGIVTQLDVIRTLPFGGKICEVELTGSLFERMLTTSDSIKGLGGYLQLTPNITKKEDKWYLNDTLINHGKIYHIASIEYLFSGQEKRLEYLNEKNPEIRSIKHFSDPQDIHSDIRLAVVKYLTGLDAKQAQK